MTMGIYAIEGPNDAIYMGSAVVIRLRWAGHRHTLRRGIHPSKHLQHAWNKYGPNAFTFSVIEVVERKEDLIATEQRWLDWLFAAVARDRIYNTATTAGSLLGISPSQATRRKLSMAMRGRVFSADHLTNLRSAMATAAYRQKRRRLIVGRRYSADHKRKIGESRLATFTARPELREQQAAQARALNETKKKTYTLISPAGEIVTIHGGKAFAREQGWRWNDFQRMLAGKRKSFK